MTKTSAEEQRELALSVLRRLREAGYEALWAGGCVRDRLLNRAPNDYDVATSATPAEIRALFGRRHTLEIGVAFGVVAVLGPKHAGMIEVTTFRKDAQYSDGRHPDSVVFSTAEEDAQRRDFTINGLFYDPLAERVIDYVGGLDDLRAGTIRAIGDPRARFAEDKLRMIRAVRFAASFAFAIDSATEKAIEEVAETIQVVSPERIAQEMRKMLVHAHRAEAVGLLFRTRLLAALLPELLVLSPDAPIAKDASGGSSELPNRWRRTKDVLTALQEPSFPLALAAMVHTLDEPADRSVVSNAPSEQTGAAERTAALICERWKLSNKEHDHATWLLAHHGRLAGAEGRPWSTVQPLLVATGGAELVALHEADGLARGAEAAAQAKEDVKFCRARLALPPDELNPKPLLDGNDLLRHGVPKGAIYRTLLDRVRAAQLDGQMTTKEESLELVDRLLDSQG